MSLEEVDARPDVVAKEFEKNQSNSSDIGSEPHSGNNSAPEDGRNTPSEGEEGIRRPGRKRKTLAACQVCVKSLKEERPYYQRYRICPGCATKDKPEKDGSMHRFCQQCGKFQPVTLFDGNMRTCRERLNRHAARRRKAHARLVSSLAAAKEGAANQQQHQHKLRERVVEQNSHSNMEVVEREEGNPVNLHSQLPQHTAALLASSAAHPTMAFAQQAMPIQLQNGSVGPTAATAGRLLNFDFANPVHHPTPLRFAPPAHAVASISASGLQIDPEAARQNLNVVLSALNPLVSAPEPHGWSTAAGILPQLQHGLRDLMEHLTGKQAAAAIGSSLATSSMDSSSSALPHYLQVFLGDMLARQHQS